MTANQVALSYLAASVLFILSLRGLSHPLSARRGNLFGMIGMVLAVLPTFSVTRGIDLIQKARGVDDDLDSGLRLDIPVNAFR